jgi:hypothetical protein
MSDAPPMRDTNRPDPSWRGLYRAGGVAAMLYVLLGIVVPTVQVVSAGYDFHLTAPALLAYIGAHRTWWIVLQTLVLGTGLLAVVVFASLFAATWRLDPSKAAVGAVVAVASQILFVAYYPVLLGLVYLSDRYAVAPDAQRVSLVAAAEALIAQNNAINPLYEPVLAASVSLLSLVMLKGIFPRPTAYVGLAVFPAALVGLALEPLVGVGYFWWWIVLVVWFTLVGWRLYELGGSHAT